MDPEDFLSPEVGITAAVVAAVASPRVRKVVRRGAVLGLAGALMAGDAITSFGRGFGQGAQRMVQNASAASKEAVQQASPMPNAQDASTTSPRDGQRRRIHQAEEERAGEPS